MESVRAFWSAVEAFADGLAAVQVWPLLIAVALHLANQVLRTRAWRSILSAAYPDRPVRWRWTYGAYLAGTGLNAIVPARGGDLVKVLAVRTRIRDSSTPTIVSSLLAETAFDFVVATSLIVWAYQTGGIPTMPEMPNAPAFEWSFFARHAREAEIAAVVLLLLAGFATRWLAHHVRAFWARVGQGLTILRSPRAYLTGVVSYQALGWGCRLGTAYFLLEAFNVHATVENAMLVLVVGSVATLMPFTPGGAGAQQALLVLVLAGQASGTTLLAYSVGAQITVTVVNAVAGVMALFLLFGSIRPRELARRARHAHAADTAATSEGDAPVVATAPSAGRSPAS